MELRHLRYFVAVAEELSFVRAAGRLRVAQPSLSKQIHNLESELGVALFDRLPRGVRLTEAGAAFLGEARTVLESAGRAIAYARIAAQDGTSDLTFAHGELSVYNQVIERLLSGFRVRHPKAELRVSSQSDANASRALRERRVDVASVFIAEWPVEGFDAHRMVDRITRAAFLPAGQPIAPQRP